MQISLGNQIAIYTPHFHAMILLWFGYMPSEITFNEETWKDLKCNFNLWVWGCLVITFLIIGIF